MKIITLLTSTMLVLGGAFSAHGQASKRMNYTGQWTSGSEGKNSVSEGYSKESNVPSHHRTRHELPVHSSPRASKIVKVYGIGRYVDPGDGRIMHERHVVYRLEEDSGWTLQPSANQPEVLLGPILGLPKAEYAPEPLNGEVGRDLIATKQSSQAALEGVRSVTQDQIKIREDLAQSLKRINQNEETLAQEISSLKARLDAPLNKEQNGNKENSVPKPTPESSPLPMSLSGTR
jgi:hypothetical protein